MVKLKKDRGRPPSQETLEKRRIDELLKNINRPISQEEIHWRDSMLRSMEEAEKEILSDYKSYPTIPRSHIFEMASLGDESMIGYENLILERDKKLTEKAIRNRHKGGNERHQNAQIRAKLICEKNQILINQMKPFGYLSKNQVATKIYEEWDHILPGNHQLGEEDLACRGIEDSGINASKVPSVRTIERYLDLGSPFRLTKVRQGSSEKK